jgi:hypothetical protein
MSRLGDIAGAVRALIRAERARDADRPPWTPLRKPLGECTLAIVAGSAYVDVAPQLDRPGVELCSFRSFSGDALAQAQTADAAGGQASGPSNFEADRLGVTVGRARELVATTGIGRLGRRHLTLTGAVDSRNRLGQQTHTAAGWLTDDQVDIALLVPM